MEHLRARFYDHPKLNVANSEQSGHASYEDVVMVELTVIGAKNESVSKVATDELKQRFPREWAEYNGERFNDANATPLTVIDGFTPARIKEFEGLGIRSVQELANVADGNIMKVREGLALKQAAVKWLEGAELAKREVTVDQIEELQDRVSQFEEMQKRLTALEEENKKLAANQRKKPGPKPKVEDESDAQAAM